jgi:hypothetical protein
VTRIDPIAMLFWAAVINGVDSVPIMVAMMLVIANGKGIGIASHSSVAERPWRGRRRADGAYGCGAHWVEPLALHSAS